MQPIHVVAGALADARGRVLVAQRPANAHQGGLWEFPGGKLEPGETASVGLRRELAEELGIEVRGARPLIRIDHDYGDRRVVLDVYRVTDYQGTPDGREGQPLDWQWPERMDASRFPPADRPVISALRLPDLYLITPDPTDVGDGFIERIEHALQRGVGAVQLRAHRLDASAFAKLAERINPLCQSARVPLLLNRDPRQAGDLPRAGWHLTATLLRHVRQRPGNATDLVGASCHTREDLRRAVELDLDYALLSPIAVTASHPTQVPLGWNEFEQHVAEANLPVYALGGLDRDALETAWQHGAQGIAAIRAFW